MTHGKCNWRNCTLIALVSAIALITGCASSVGALISQSVYDSDQRAMSRGKELLTEHLKLIEKLRAEGDPMGEYLWTRANADAWVDNPIKDPLVLKTMYENAAAKGSVDAQHMVGLMLFDGSSSRSGVCTDCPVLKPEDRDWHKGLAIIEDATKKQCFYWGIVLDGMANRSCLTPVVTAGKVWPKFRDGRIFEKNPDTLALWKQMEDTCDAKLKLLPISYFFTQKFAACR